MIIYTTRYIPEWSAGCAIGPFILIKPAYKDDAGLAAHERVHTRQWWLLALLALPLAALAHANGRPDLMGFAALALGLHPALYLASARYRLRCEVAAYRVQLGYYAADRRDKFAGFIASRYRLNVTPAQAFELLKD